MSGAETGPHLHYAAALHFDYAKDPLVFENVAGRSSSERVALVSDQLAAHAAISLGLYDIALLYAELPVNLWMDGTALGSQPTATGFGAGDLLLGSRLALHRGAIGKAALQLSVTAPTAEGGSHGRPGVAGDSGATLHPEVTSEITAGPIVVLLEAGALFRKDARIAGTRFTDVLTFGAGVSAPIVQQRLRALLEAYGETPLDDVGNRAGSPLEALLGAKLTPVEGFTCGLAGGLGLLHGYGSPRARIVAMLGYSGPNETASEHAQPSSARETAATPPPTHPEPAVVQSAPPAPPVRAPDDRDEDGVGDVDDRCPIAPGPADNAGCPRHLQYDEKTGEIAFAHALRFEGSAKNIRLAGDAALDELLAFLQANPEMRVRVEAHVSRASADARRAMPLSVQRASAVARFLVDSGVTAQRLEAVGCGSNRPIVADRGSQRAKNERVVLYVLHPLPEAGLRSSLGCEAEVEKRPEPAPAALREPEAPAPVHEVPRKPEPPAKPTPAPTAAASPLVLNAPSGSDSHRVDLAAGRIELLKPIRFDDGTAQLNPRSQGYLVEIAATLQANPKIQILIESHVAAEADARASLALSQQRAKVVRQQLVDRGVAPSRLKAYGCGENRPLAPNNVPWGRKKNDRVELHLLDPAPSSGVHSTEGCSASE